MWSPDRGLCCHQTDKEARPQQWHHDTLKYWSQFLRGRIGHIPCNAKIRLATSEASNILTFAIIICWKTSQYSSLVYLTTNLIYTNIPLCIMMFISKPKSNILVSSRIFPAALLLSSLDWSWSEKKMAAELGSSNIMLLVRMAFDCKLKVTQKISLGNRVNLTCYK